MRLSPTDKCGAKGMRDMENDIKKGGISVETEHIFPVIKKWLYSEKEIFLREIISNACDAATKMKRLSSLGEVKGLEDENYRIDIILDKTSKTITVRDNGIGMTEDEVEKYICQMALSGAVDFIEKYEGKDSSGDSGIIGHFGLGFYSAFMVSDRVDVITKSYTGAPSVEWHCDESGSYEFASEADKDTRGTDIIMHISDEGEEYLNAYKLREIITKYCSFMPIDIFFTDVEKEKNEETADKTEEPINDKNPLWLKNPSECTKEEYVEFYHKVFGDFREPLFYIHLNVDYPLNFKGILYFPKLTHEYDSLEGQVKLYYNQVYVADNIKEVIPEYLLMLKGVLDCPELPLNVSRSYLQNSGYVSKISSHIVKKVADKINSLFNTEREEYEKLWRDIKTFVEYGCLRDKKFFDRVANSIIWEKTSGEFVTLDTYLEAAKEKHENTVYYATDKVAQAQYISMFEKENIDVVILDSVIETQFVTLLENEKKIKFVRIDADVAALKNEGDAGDEPKLTELLKKVSANDKLTVKYEYLKDETTPAVLNISEDMRRMNDMMRMYGMNKDGELPPEEATLIVNKSSSTIKHLIDVINTENGDDRAEKIASQLYTLALLAQRRLTADELKAFLLHSYDMLEKM